MPAEPGAIRVKICGLSTAETVDAAVTAGVDWLGFNFFPRSPRYVTPAKARRLCELAPISVGIVALLVKPTDDDVAAVLAEVPGAILQLYDTAERCSAIRERFGVPVWQAVGVSAASDLPDRSVSDGLVIESRPPAGADRPGGNGHGFDWSITAGWRAAVPWMLAGGLRPDNVRQAIELSGTAAVDVASGVESAPGIKDVALIRSFVRAAHGG